MKNGFFSDGMLSILQKAALIEDFPKYLYQNSLTGKNYHIFIKDFSYILRKMGQFSEQALKII